ncbi:MAG: sulfotransferase [Gammaproteobacteria bacterium]|nr:sulfotransferase [Gammaproteobacteria bacterium]
MPASASADLELMHATLLLESDPAAAARRAAAIPADSRAHSEAQLLIAVARRRLGDPAGAAAVLETLARIQPHSALIQLELGRAYAAAGRADEALAALEHSVGLDARLGDAWRELAALRHANGDTLAGDTAYAHYVRLAPQVNEHAEASGALAIGRVHVAEAILQRRLQQVPDDVAALLLLADAARRREDDATAERRLAECLAIAPGFAGARYDLACLLNEQQRILEMLPHLDRLLASDPGNINYLNVKAQGLRFVGRSSEAIALMEQALAEHPEDEVACVLCGSLLRETGETARAIEMYRRALGVRPGCSSAYSSLANMKTYRFTREDLTDMQQQLALPSVRGTDRIRLEFALGKGLEDATEYADSFAHYERGNRLQRETLYYDPGIMTAEVQGTRTLSTPQFFSERAGWGSTRSDPIFVVGLPRAGSTLLEQMLASHSQVEGTRELLDIPRLMHELVSAVPTPTATTLNERLEALDRTEVEALAQRYLERTQPARQLDKPHFIDKLPGNWCYIGVIHLLFPRAAIIDARRHPLGCGFSCYKQLFNRGHKYAYDLTELGLFYRDYASLLEHFDALLPGRVHRVHYEQLIADPEAELRRLLEYCRLPFEPECLRFYANRRVVHTLSSEQVRQPIYADSIDQWRHYEPWLGPLKQALGDLVERYPTSGPAAG